MNDQRKTKKQLLEDLALAQERIELEQARSSALQEVSKKLAAAHDTDEVLNLIVNEAARLIGATGAYIRLLEGTDLVPSASTESLIGYVADNAKAQPTVAVESRFGVGHVMATKKPAVREDATVDERVSPEVRLIFKQHGFHGAALVPMVANDRSIGVLSVMDKRIRHFTEDEVSLLAAFADQAALALDKARLLNEAEREKERSDALYRVSNLLAGAHDTDDVLDLIVNEAGRLLVAPSVNIRLLDGDTLVTRATTRSPMDNPELIGRCLKVGDEGGLVGHVMATKKPLFGEEALQMILPEARKLIEERGLDPAALAVVPLLANDRSIGALRVADAGKLGRRFTEDEVSLLKAFADQASLALEKARLLKEAETERERSDALYRVSNLLAGAHDTNEVLELIVNEAARLVGTHGAYIRLLEGGALVVNVATASAAEYVADAASLFPGFKVEEGTSAFGHTMATQMPVVIEDTQNSEWAKDAMRANLMKHGIDSVAHVPLLANDMSLGVLVVLETRVRRFTEDEVSLLSAFADQASLALEKARLLNEAEARERQATQLYEVTTQLASNYNMDSVLELIAERAKELLKSDASSIWRYDE
ncbi:MAG: GAF domain-containing protein [Chloroflexi bacterium]|nr:GAF domain-containing protein [Chloroflexota bacterium]